MWKPKNPPTAQAVRSPKEQARINQECADLALYHFVGCPFCSRVTRVIEQLALPIELRDIHLSPARRTELIEGGGRQTVPCLRIIHPDGQVQWLYESMDIIRYLEQRFAA